MRHGVIRQSCVHLGLGGYAAGSRIADMALIMGLRSSWLDKTHDMTKSCLCDT
jgi:hypothetical protein